jgi:hypothetical protein
MTTEERKKLRRYLKALQGFQTVLMERSGKNVGVVNEQFAQTMAPQIYEMYGAFPNLIPYFTLERHVQERDGDGVWYNVDSLRAYLHSATAGLDVELSEADEAPVTETRTFGFINDPAIRSILERDYSEVQRAYVAKCWKASIVLAGGLIEAMLVDRLKANQAQAMASAKAPPKNKSDIERWDLYDLILVATDLGYITPGTDRLSHPLREYRNLVHAGNEVRNKLILGQEEARIALEIVHLVYRDLK